MPRYAVKGTIAAAHRAQPATHLAHCST
jgi:hypothetical protein